MVFYFTSNVISPTAQIYVGKDKFESMNFLLVDKTSVLLVCLIMPRRRIDQAWP